MGRPAPLKTRPTRSSETPRRASRSTRDMEVCTTSRPMVSSNTWTTAISSETSITCPFSSSPSGVRMLTTAL